MAAVILTQDLLAICLLLADGDIRLSIDEVVRRAEAFQVDHDRHFGLSREDFRTLLVMLLVVELGIRTFDEAISDIRLSDILLDMLHFHDAYFNDEGSHWVKDGESGSRTEKAWFIESWLGYKGRKYQEKLEMKEKMGDFFRRRNISAFSPKSVEEFMKEMNISEELLYDASRPGESS